MTRFFLTTLLGVGLLGPGPDEADARGRFGHGKGRGGTLAALELTDSQKEQLRTAEGGAPCRDAGADRRIPSAGFRGREGGNCHQGNVLGHGESRNESRRTEITAFGFFPAGTGGNRKAAPGTAGAAFPFRFRGLQSYA